MRAVGWGFHATDAAPAPLTSSSRSGLREECSDMSSSAGEQLAEGQNSSRSRREQQSSLLPSSLQSSCQTFARHMNAQLCLSASDHRENRPTVKTWTSYPRHFTLGPDSDLSVSCIRSADQQCTTHHPARSAALTVPASPSPCLPVDLRTSTLVATTTTSPSPLTQTPEVSQFFTLV